AYWEIKRWDEVEYAFKKSLELKPGHYLKLMNLGALHFHLKRFDKAEELYRQSIEAHPCSVNWSSLGSLYREKKMYDKAEKFYLKSLTTNDFFVFSAVNLVCMTFTDRRDRVKGSEYLGKYLLNEFDIERNLDWMIDIMIDLCADDFSHDVLEVIERSDYRNKLEPLIAGIRLYHGEDENTIKVAPEIIEIGRDVKGRIEKAKKKS
ncbi:MAG: tetratricopeptide repeat protein, partial [SAR324 cluster bacterium]|nr:tetratricopeptide repeat protein [SAR324 cluster bacterium]